MLIAEPAEEQMLNLHSGKKIIIKVKFIIAYHYKMFFWIIPFLLLRGTVLSQNDTANQLVRKFQQYQIHNFQEKLYIHTDKTFYLAGEQIRMKVYLTDGFYHKLCNLSKVAYVEVLDKNQVPVLQTKIEIDNGTGNASIKIPISLRTGNYLLRGYTQWIKNYSADFYFEQAISIINTLNESAKPFTENQVDSFDVQFFPEGGNLVNGIVSDIAFKVINQYEEGFPCTAVVMNQNKDTVARFETFKFGMGHFIFKPEKNEHYSAFIKIGDTTIIKDLPAASDQGYTMSVSNNDDQNLKITIRSAGVLQDEMIYLFIHSGQINKLIQPVRMKNGVAVFYVDKGILNDGISHLTIFNEGKLPVCERLYFKMPQKKLGIHLTTSQRTFNTRDLVSISINTQNEHEENIPANMSISVFLIDSLQSEKHTDILSYLLLTSDLKGRIESLGYYFDDTIDKGERQEAANNLMLTQGWSRFRWNDVLQNVEKPFEYLPEMEGPIIHGKITDRRSGLPAQKIMAYLSVPGKYYKFSAAVSDSSGEIAFNPGIYYETNEIIVQTNNQIDSNYRINITDPFSYQYSSSKILPFTLNKKNYNDLLKRSIASQVENLYHHIDVNTSFYNTDTIAFYGNPDKSYFLDAYTRFTSMEEVMREYVKEVRVKQKGTNFHFRVWNSKYSVFIDQDPLILLDGVPVFNTNKIIAFNPLKIKKLDIVTQNNLTGCLISAGILSYTTYNGDLAGFPLDANAFLLEYEGLQKQKEFYMPGYLNKEQKESRLPDMRNVLFWDPNITTDKTGKSNLSFYTSDLKGNYAIIVEGISNEGIPGHSLLYINTK